MGQGSGLWPHSPAMPLGPAWIWAIDDEASAAAGAEDDGEDGAEAVGCAVGSLRDGARQLASLAMRTSRPMAALRSTWRGLAVEPGGVGVFDQAGGGSDGAGDAGADGGGLASDLGL